MLAGLLVVGCADEPTSDESVVDDSANIEQEEQDGSKALSVDGRVFSIPAPAQTAIMLKGLGMGYDEELTADPESAAKMSSKEGKALLMGMFGADLAYSVAFQDGQSGITLFKAIEGIAADLSLENAVDKELVERFMSNVGNDDSLLVLSGAAYRAADQYLKRNDRNDVSSLVLAGGWLETMHIALSVHSNEPNPVLVQKIAEQRSALSNLVAVLESARENERVASLIAGLDELNTLFQNVKESYTFEEPATDVANRTTFINSKTKFEMDDEMLQLISDKVGELRSMMLSQQ